LIDVPFLRRYRCPGVTAIAVIALLASPRAVRADGAFPDSLGIIVPADRPHDILLATNFGVVSSIDDGQTWTYSCEQDQNAFGAQYQMSAPPLDRIYTRAGGALAFSDNRACGWTVAGGAVASDVITDAFLDPTNSSRVLVVAQSTGADGGIGYRVFESSDAGATFPTLRYTAASGDIVNGIESARSAPATVYLTLMSGSPAVPKLGKSTDGGATWQLHELTAALGAGVRSFSLIAVDPVNAARVYLRVADANGERLAITDDGGATAMSPLMLPGGVMTAFVRTPSGAMLLTGKVGLGAVMYRSTDGATFQMLPVPPTLRSMAARGSLIYGASDTQIETSGAFVSSDQGQSWQPLLSFDAIQAIDPCVKAKCQDDCAMRVALGQWSPDVCDAVPAPRAVDGGVSSTDAAADHPAADGGTPLPPKPASGCHCAADDRGPGSPAAAALTAAMLLLAYRRRRRGPVAHRRRR
jgi:MYXO-CTERM domain-containing protein